MQFARAEWQTLGGTSAGKALHLAALGLDVSAHALIGDDEAGERVRGALSHAGVTVTAYAASATERHVNLMTSEGERVSLYVASPAPARPADVAVIGEALRASEIAIIDLSPLGADLLAGGFSGGFAGRIWTDLHDYDGMASFHEPFLRSADAVFMNDDAVDDPWALLQSCIDRGPRLAVCTLGARGAIALDAAGRRAEVAAVETDVIDTNGAGDAFFAGFLAAHLDDADLSECLAAGAGQAVVALGSIHLHPDVVGTVDASS